MPKIEWIGLPPALRDHLFDRARERKVSIEDLYQLKLWCESEPEAPDGPWYKDFGTFKICGAAKRRLELLHVASAVSQVAIQAVKNLQCGVAGDGFVGVPVNEFRGAVLRPFLENRMSIAVGFLIANGYTGQTTEVISFPSDALPIERVVGVPLKSYVSASWTCYFKR